jgi:hypothetical protein
MAEGISKTYLTSAELVGLIGRAALRAAHPNWRANCGEFWVGNRRGLWRHPSAQAGGCDFYHVGPGIDSELNLSTKFLLGSVFWTISLACFLAAEFCGNPRLVKIQIFINT